MCVPTSTWALLNSLFKAAIFVLTCLNLTLLGLVHGQTPGIDTIRLLSAFLAVLASSIMGFLSYLEHVKVPRTSLFLNAYLLVNVVFDIVRTRTLWLVFGSQAYSILFTISTALTATIIMLETIPKKHWQVGSVDALKLSPEETSGLYSHAFMSWLHPLILLGNRTILDTDDLYVLDSRLAAETVSRQFQQRWQATKGSPSRILMAALYRSFFWSFVKPIPSRLAMLAFSFCQPFFIQRLIKYLEADPASPKHDIGWQLILASILIYGGIALSRASFYYLHKRNIVRIRCALVTAIFQKATELNSVHLDTSILTLMSADVDRIDKGMEPMHDLWANSVEVVLASYLLYRQLALAFLGPLAVVAVCVLTIVAMGSVIGRRMLVWARFTEQRVKLTSAVVSNMKPLKISGATGAAAKLLQSFRITELRAGNAFRILIIVSIGNAFAPVFLSPVVAFVLAGQRLDMSKVFTSLSLLTLITEPLGQLFQKVPLILAQTTALKRIQEFLAIEPRTDPRLFGDPAEPELDSFAISLVKASVGWNEDRRQLRDISLNITKSHITIVTGAVASGKSTLCKAILGEVPFVDGTIKFHQHQPRIGYCDQTPYLVNDTLRANIIGFEPFDSALYDEVLDVTLLKPDLRILPRGDETKVGSGGVGLSGGQKQRVALARALYLSTDIYVLDDFTVGLDRSTADEVVRRLFKPDGFLLNRGATVVWCTHSISYLSLAQHIVALGADGCVLHQGSPDEVLKNRQVTLALEHDEGREDSNDAADSTTEKILGSEDAADTRMEERDTSRALNGWDVYSHYFSTFSPSLIIFTALVVTVFGFCATFGTVWLKFWADNSLGISGSQSRINRFYLGVFAAIQLSAIITFLIYVACILLGMATASGLALHFKAVQVLVRAPFRYITSTDQGVIVNLFSQDFQLIDSVLPFVISNTFAIGVLALGLATVVALGTPPVAIGFPVILLFLARLTRLYLRTSRQLRLLELENKSPLYTQFGDAVRGIATVRALGWTAHCVAQNRRSLEDALRPLYLFEMVSLWLSLVLGLVVGGVAVAVTVLASLLVDANGSKIAGRAGSGAGFVGAGLVSLMMLGGFLNAIVQSWVTLETTLGAVRRLRDFGRVAGDESGPGEDLRPGEGEWPARGEIAIREVGASYYDQVQDIESYQDDGVSSSRGSTLALRQISMETRAGEKVGIVGRTGSGKSSLVLLLLRLLDATPDTTDGVTIDDLPLRRIHRDTLRERIIAMPQDTVFLAAGETFKAAVDPYSRATDDECRAALRHVGLLEAVDDAGGLQAPVGRDSLSQGQKQLFGLAIAILRAHVRERSGIKGGILLLDEVTSNVDTQTEKTIMKIIKQVFKEYTVVAVTHSLESVVDFDRVLVMAEGKIIKEGTPKSLIKERGDAGFF